MRAPRGPWGGAGTFVQQLDGYLTSRGYRVVYKLDASVDVAVIIDPRIQIDNRTFGAQEIRRQLDARPDLKVLHRVNECDKRKNTDFMDKELAAINRLANYTVFLSEWLRDYHAAIWFDRSRPHSVIYNGADPRLFYPGKVIPRDGRSVIATHHWSDSPMKGFAVYAEIDRLIASGRLPGVELRVIGRWPKEIRWRAATTVPPKSGQLLADELRRCDAYITASLWEPGGMHHVEAAQCGLPVAYHADGGGIGDMCRRYGVEFRDDPAAAIEALVANLPVYRRAALINAPSGDRMVNDYANVIQALLFSG